MAGLSGCESGPEGLVKVLVFQFGFFQALPEPLPASSRTGIVRGIGIQLFTDLFVKIFTLLHLVSVILSVFASL